MRSFGIRYPESVYSPRSGNMNLYTSDHRPPVTLESRGAYQVKTKVNQYADRHATSMTRSGKQMPRDPSSLVLEVDARSMGTKRMILMGKAMAKKTGTSRYAGVVRSGRK